MSSFTGTQVLRVAIETMSAKAQGSDVLTTITMKSDGNFGSAKFVKGRTSIKIDSECCDGHVAITVSPPAPFRCLLSDPESTRTTEMVYGSRKFVRTFVVPRNDFRDIPAHIVFNIELWQGADTESIVARIADRF